MAHISDLHLAKLLNVLSIVDDIETYVKILAFDYKIDKHEAQELLNYTQRAKDIL